MRRVLAMAAMGLLVLTLPALAVVPAATDNDHTMAGGTGTRSLECPGVVVWDTGMYDEFTPPTGVASAPAAQCYVNADTTGVGSYPLEIGGWGYLMRWADDWICVDPTLPITHMKVWVRMNATGYAYHRDKHTLGFETVHGFCVKMYEAIDYLGNYPWCPDGTVPGELAIGTLPWYEYAPLFQEEEVLTGLSRHFAYCIYFPHAFYPVLDKWYWASAIADFDSQLYDDPQTPAVDTGLSQTFARAFPGLGISACEAENWSDGFGYNWNRISVNNSQPGWAGWDMGWKIYSGEIPVPTEPTTWGKIKASYR